ncbi:DUF4136 domain-containing protein [Alkalimonas collagenimarina]|uniref:DUF4136 domain-containing protein n=1 Tax=Alkalimonas collagenimarina TaxID=400390 RepID=A0ABT9GXG2_9GAMM|nr:DUF4136 domain-containing protein [Alkalimonas collagenimarina]MDP4535741.1 DUF4136 domain-containing protein [Alkalimonas collagenimarina]
MLSPKQESTMVPSDPKLSFSLVTVLMMLVIMLVISGCSVKPDARVDYARDVNFSQYQTFGFYKAPGTDTEEYQSLLTDHFKSALRAEMEALGYRYQEDDAELLLNFASNTEDKTDIRSSPFRANIGFGHYGYRSAWHLGFPLYQQDIETVHYKQGTVQIDLVDAAQNKLIWQGIQEGRLTREALKNPKQAVEETVAHLFQQFPGRQ